MDYTEKVAQIERVKDWMKKAAQLKIRYENEKIACIKRIDTYYKKPDLKNLYKSVTELQNIITRKQVPLYNNLVNYSQNVLLDTLTRLSEETPQLPIEVETLLFICRNIFLDEFEKMRAILRNQEELFNHNDIHTTEGCFAILEEINRMTETEQATLRMIEKDIRLLIGKGFAAEKEIEQLTGMNRTLAREWRLHQTHGAVERLGGNIRTQALLAASVLIAVAVAHFIDPTSALGIGTLPWAYKIFFRWLPALAKKDVAEIIADLA